MISLSEQINAYRHSLDPNGIRAVAFILLRSYLCEKTQSLSKVEFPARDHAWALHSESKVSLVRCAS